MTENKLIFKDYNETYFDECLVLFDKNCPAYFAPDEREDYIEFLKSKSKVYKIGFIKHQVVAVFGFDIDLQTKRARITWIMTCPSMHAKGLGSEMMLYAKKMAIAHQIIIIDIAASHLSAPFFKKFGAKAIGEIKDGWGLNIDRIDMELLL